MAMLLGKKVGMTRVYDEAGRLIPVTVIEAGPCPVTQVKTREVDGYNAIQLGYDDVKVSRQKQPQVGHTAKANATPKRFVKEWRLAEKAEPEQQLGDSVTVAIFAETKYVDVVARARARGLPA